MCVLECGIASILLTGCLPGRYTGGRDSPMDERDRIRHGNRWGSLEWEGGHTKGGNERGPRGTEC